MHKSQYIEYQVDVSCAQWAKYQMQAGFKCDGAPGGQNRVTIPFINGIYLSNSYNQVTERNRGYGTPTSSMFKPDCVIAPEIF